MLLGLLLVLVLIYSLYPSSSIVLKSNVLAAITETENLRRNSFTHNLSVIDIDNLTDEQLALTIHSYLDNDDVICQRKLRMGAMDDGGWEICDDPDVRPRSPCIIYSFGIAYDFTFDDDAARVYGCNVYSFDPSMDRVKTSRRSDLVMFYKIGLGPSSETNARGWQMKTLMDIRTEMNHRDVAIDVLKMDIENSEWESIPQMIRTGQLRNVRQFLIEYHVMSESREYLLPKLKTIQAVEKAGFKRFYVHKNFHCVKNIPRFPLLRTHCYEIHYLKRP